MDIPLYGEIEHSELSDRELRVLEYIGSKPDANVATIAREYGISERSVQQDMKKLRDLGIIVREGSNKTGRWIVFVS